MYKLLGTHQEEWEKQTINHDLYFFQLSVSMLLGGMSKLFLEKLTSLWR